nr:hypothetical protein [Tanacetum cinerariifolium]
MGSRNSNSIKKPFNPNISGNGYQRKGKIEAKTGQNQETDIKEKAKSKPKPDKI